MIYRIFVEKKPALANDAKALAEEIRTFLGITSLTGLRIVNRYDVEGIEKDLFDVAVRTVFSEPQLDHVSDTLAATEGETIFAVEYLPGQFDQRADSAAQCIQMISKGERPLLRTAKIYVLSGTLSREEVAEIKKYVINPVESREASLVLPETLAISYEIPTTVKTLNGFIKLSVEELNTFLQEKGLAMDLDDLQFCQNYFIEEQRDPTITEIRLIDTYWSDHCRHTTFLTTIDDVKFEDPLLQKTYESYLAAREELNRTKPVTLMDLGTLAAKYLKKTGELTKLDESEEINACTVKMTVTTEDGEEPWLLLFKNETHNHPTEIEPFGGAATCIGGAIRDPLSGRAYVYGAMRVTGAADPRRAVSETLPGKLPQKKLVTTAAAGYSSYGNQIGLATGQVDELYHDGYAAKRMEIGAVIAAAPAENVRREVPAPGDVVILLGGKTGRDGCGGATGSSKSHTLSSLEECGAEVQKGNAPEERKLQRLFRNVEASRMIKRCNDFGAGGVSVAIGELADGLSIHLDLIPKKYDGLDGTELAISESQERMAVVVEPDCVDRFCEIAASENLEATVVATVTEEPRMTMDWNGNEIVNLSRAFLNSNGAEKHITIEPEAAKAYTKEIPISIAEGMKAMCTDLNVCSKKGLSERFDSTIGAGSVLMPFGGKYQQTPIQAMVQKISMEKKFTDSCSYMAWGYNPFITEQSPYHGAYLAVVESAAKLIATGASFEDTYLTFQEYFEKPGKNPKRWGKPFAALLGAYRAQVELGIAAIGGKDSMSGSFESLDVPPTLVSFAVTTGKTSEVISPEWKKTGHAIVLIRPAYDENNLPTADSLKKLFAEVHGLMADGKVYSAWTPGFGGVAEGIFKASIGNRIGFTASDAVDAKLLFDYNYGAFLLEMVQDEAAALPGDNAIVIGTTTEKEALTFGDESLTLAEMTNAYEDVLESVYSCNIKQGQGEIPTISSEKKLLAVSSIKVAKPKALIPVFPGTNCEFDTARALSDAGADPEIFVIRNLNASAVAESIEGFAKQVKQSQMIVIPGGFSAGDEPEGSGKFITAFFRSDAVREAVTELLEERDGLMSGICNGFQALIKLGLVPFGKIMDTDADCPTLSYNTIGRHQSKIVQVRVASNQSPWLSETEVGSVYAVPISHGEGRFLANDKVLASLRDNGQIATQYVDLDGVPTADVAFNPNNSAWAIEGITSPDGRVFGKMGHAERIAKDIYQNVPGNYDMGMFRSAVRYFQ